MRGALKGKTILLVTHQVDFLHNVDLILVSVLFLREGKKKHSVLLVSVSHSLRFAYVAIPVFEISFCFVMPGYERGHDSAIGKVQ